MPTVTSKDGTRIAYETLGSGPPLILVDGALCFRGSGPSRPLAEQLKDRFTVYIYDRRGRGESGDTLPYAPEREVEDIEALIAAAGGSAMLYGISSGGVLALDAASHDIGVSRVFVYEAPLIVDDSRTLAPGYAEKMQALVAADRRGAALKHFMGTGVGLPGFMVFIMQFMPMWKTLKQVAPTLAYDTALTAPLQQGRPLSPERWASVKVPAKIVGGTKSETWMRNAQRAIARILPDARHAELEGENHMVKPEKIAPMIKEFFAA
ncbi:MAG TPA: alpha/beta hydrolase [Devosiaceae bacterium]|jgi:pimeloyl-ACP methyl ester carboxylesterase|nr:alpha/beta hydrolase [Devosiaceae bacterium]